MTLANRLNDLIKSMEGRSGSQLSRSQIESEMSALQVYKGDGYQSNKMPVDKLLKQYQSELDKFYEKHGLGEGALQKEYQAHGLTNKNQSELYQRKLKELGLDQLPF